MNVSTGCLLLGLMLSSCVTAVAADRKPPAKITFDTDPKWDGFRNRLLPESLPVVKQDFGYQRSNHAGGSAAGEIGGTIQRSTTPARYSTAIPAKTLDDKLSASGTFAVPSTHSSAGVMFGWFNENSSGWRTPNSLAFRLDGNDGKYWVFYEYGTKNRRTGGGGAFVGERYQTTPTPPFKADGTPHRWSLTYDPQANGGCGLMTFRIDEDKYEVPFAEGHREDGAVFNRFGIWTVETGGHPMEVYFDDLKLNGELLSFDRDPWWIGEGNATQFAERVIRPYHDYGYSETSHTGDEPGEIGGIIFRDEQPSYHAAEVGPLSLDQPLHASGKVVLNSAGADSGIFFGWFDSASKRNKSTPEHEQRQANYLGVMVEGPSRVGHYFRAAYSNAEGDGDAPTGEEAGMERPLILPNGAVHEWSIDYSPTAADGHGRMTVTFDATSHTLDLRPEHRAAGASFDRFGLFNIQSGGHHVEIYLDDLTFTAATSSQ